MTLATIFNLYLAVVIFVVIPGPGVMAMLAVSAEGGFSRGVLMGLGALTGDLTYAAIVVFSLGLVADQIEPYMVFVRLGGGGYLVYLGVKMILTAVQSQRMNREESDASLVKNRQSAGKLYLTGAIISWTNPKVIIFYLSFFPLFVNVAVLDFYQRMGVMAIVSLGLITGVAIVSAGGGSLQKMIKNPIMARRINSVCGVILIMVGLVLGWPT
ncbi:MAG: LysE family translocator [Candidatus Pacebacteria bacterium]|nr:LysE family translocator [Candidatus Paceibacterota bacterium]